MQPRKDLYLEALQGTVVTVEVGRGEAARSYKLHRELLRMRSYYFIHEIRHLNQQAAAAVEFRRKRKLELGGESDNSALPYSEYIGDNAVNNIIRIPDVDPSVFGVFVRFLYTSRYPNVVVATPTSSTTVPQAGSFTRQVPNMAHAPGQQGNLQTTQQGPQHQGQQTHAQSRPEQANSVPDPRTRYTQLHRAPDQQVARQMTQTQSALYHGSFTGQQTAYTPNFPRPAQGVHPPTPTISPQVPTATMYRPHPVAIDAWLLGQHLGSTGFMNHAMVRVFNIVGHSYPLTAYLADYIWTRTNPHAMIRSPNPAGFSFSRAARYPEHVPRPPALQGLAPHWNPPMKQCQILDPNPLRKLVFDMLVSQWDFPHSRMIVHGPDWSTLMAKHADLKLWFDAAMNGQARYVVGPLERYYVGSVGV